MTTAQAAPRRIPPQSVHVPLLDRGYDVIVGQRMISQAGTFLSPILRSPRVIIVSDESVAEHYHTQLQSALVSQGLRVDTLLVPPGEASKSFGQLEALLDGLLSLEVDRNVTLIAFGGGVVGDLVGFAASILLRVVDFVQMPTTLLSQVDSSVGGKTAVNMDAGKNLVGSFYQPKMVLADLEALTTLPEREIKAGYAEVVKYGLIMHADFFGWCERNGGALLQYNMEALQRAIIACCQMKAEIVSRDEREASSRALLNFGHTFGHALEAETGFSSTLLHGEAVAIGMVMGCRLSQKLGLIEGDVEERLVKHFEASGMPKSLHDINHDWTVDGICQHFSKDKKAEGGKLTFIVLEALGKARVQKDVDPDVARSVVEAFIAEGV